MDHKTSHLWHVWINKEQGVTVPSPPWVRALYAYKGAVTSFAYVRDYIKRAFTGELRATHKQCSHSPTEEIQDNVVMCPFLKDITECEHLKRLREEFANRAEFYKDADEWEAMAHTCLAHGLASESLIDWNEGFMQDKSDRRFWERTYQSLAGGGPEPEQRDGVWWTDAGRWEVSCDDKSEMARVRWSEPHPDKVHLYVRHYTYLMLGSAKREADEMNRLGHKPGRYEPGAPR